jgi:hypothetical protein
MDDHIRTIRGRSDVILMYFITANYPSKSARPSFDPHRTSATRHVRQNPSRNA